MQTKPKRSNWFWLMFMGMCLSLSAQKQGQNLKVEIRPSTALITTQNTVVTPKEVIISWDEIPGYNPTRYEFESSTDLNNWNVTSIPAENTVVENDRVSYTVGPPTDKEFFRNVQAFRE
jgi:hypothetical protein